MMSGGRKRQFTLAAAAKPARAQKTEADAACVATAQTQNAPATDNSNLSPSNITKVSARSLISATDGMKVWKAGTRVSLDYLKDCDLVMAFDVETHQLIPDQATLAKFATSEYALATKVGKAGIETLHVIQIGWAIGSGKVTCG